jgi:hypothetical protein
MMRGAFVVELWNVGPQPSCQLEGSVEEVDTGRLALFRSDDQLIEFLRRRSAEPGRRLPKDGGVE